MSIFDQGLKTKFNEPLSTKDFETIFTKIAEEKELKSFKELEEYVGETFDNKKMNDELTKFAEKLKLDRNKLTKLFHRD